MHRTAPAAQRASVSTAVRRQHAKERQKAYGPSSKSRIIVAVILVAVFAAIGVAVAVNQSGESKYASCEKWRSTMVAACKACDLDVDWTNALLAAMYVESGGDTGVKSVTGAKGDIMQAAEGAYGYILTDGSKEYGVRANTPEASIYAGVLEFKQNLETWDSYLGGISPTDADKIQLVVQGYNFGADGWFKWCEERGITEYTVEAATQYSNEEMPEDAKGTPTHGQKWLTAFKRIRKNARNGLGIVYVERNACGGCFNRIPPQKQLEIKIHKKIIVCEYCGRILIDPAIAGVEE